MEYRTRLCVVIATALLAIVTSRPVAAEMIAHYTFSGTLETGDTVTGRFAFTAAESGDPFASEMSFTTPFAVGGDIEWGWFEYYGFVFESTVEPGTLMVRFSPVWLPMPTNYDARLREPSALSLVFYATADQLASGTVLPLYTDSTVWRSAWTNLSEGSTALLTSGVITPVPEPSAWILLSMGVLVLSAISARRWRSPA